ncbi:MAG: four helix bundle protein [Nonlabens sp.]|uniref:four helix bundle protein n=1 Tax=Nonlabens sp. TaxID=1888209 RepID=UPI003EF30D2B
MQKNVIVEKSTEFALEIISFTTNLKKEKHFEISSQLFRSGTSIGANVNESQNAESRKDFVHKLKIAAKEASETRYWLYLCTKSDSLISPKPELLEQLETIEKLLSRIIATTKSRM